MFSEEPELRMIEDGEAIQTPAPESQNEADIEDVVPPMPSPERPSTPLGTKGYVCTPSFQRYSETEIH